MGNFSTASYLEPTNKFWPSYKVIHPIMDSSLITIKLFLSSAYYSLFDSSLFYNFVMLLDTDLSVVSYHINKELMISNIKLCQGLNFRAENMGKTSVSECLQKKALSVMYYYQNDNIAFQSLTNCTIPIIINDKIVAYLSTFFMHSKYDEISVNYFKLFEKSLDCTLQFHTLKINITELACKTMLPTFSTASLTDCELEVLEQINKGYTNKEIANRLFISENTVKSYIQIISQKLSCENRTQIAVNSVLYTILRYI
ncbi:regulatory LuxR family protein [Ruminiclostridium sufflavum DSM 19573]|uniref:Regulatory LuxR family protein n=1 Tax=Ruminiclostridium sufflavum DSM 19573 TaxID=1121337 RepID=A0A318XQU6_9FIRM|nr:helix-turn-helix transcriptional regulator [Ruminiclostridium sufflavum]PYG89575.1 regulatory LuxR family protein [Ruminiclostridium sufflavum DSM 19573]